MVHQPKGLIFVENVCNGVAHGFITFKGEGGGVTYTGEFVPPSSAVVLNLLITFQEKWVADVLNAPTCRCWDGTIWVWTWSLTAGKQWEEEEERK